MKRGIWIGLLATLAFVMIVIARLPASWMAGYLPNGITCTQISGTVWSGACAGLTSSAGALGDLDWKLHPAALLSGKIGSHVTLQGPAGSIAAELTIGSGGAIDAREVSAQFSLERVPLPQAPKDLRGAVHAELSRLALTKGVVTAAEGRIEVRGLENRSSRTPVLGDYDLTFPATRARSRDGEPIGDLDSVKGPWKLQASLRLTPEPGFEIEGRIAPGPGAPQEVLRQLDFLGAADSQGWRPFSLAGSF